MGCAFDVIPTELGSCHHILCHPVWFGRPANCNITMTDTSLPQLNSNLQFACILRFIVYPQTANTEYFLYCASSLDGACPRMILPAVHRVGGYHQPPSAARSPPVPNRRQVCKLNADREPGNCLKGIFKVDTTGERVIAEQTQQKSFGWTGIGRFFFSSAAFTVWAYCGMRWFISVPEDTDRRLDWPGLWAAHRGPSCQCSPVGGTHPPREGASPAEEWENKRESVPVSRNVRDAVLACLQREVWECLPSLTERPLTCSWVVKSRIDTWHKCKERPLRQNLFCQSCSSWPSFDWTTGENQWEKNMPMPVKKTLKYLKQ